MTDTALESTQWYRADSRLGELYLGVPGRVPDTLGQACLLNDVELLLQAVELWQDIDIDPQPVAQSPSGKGCRIRISPRAMPTCERDAVPTDGALPCGPLVVDIPLERLPSMYGIDAAVGSVIDTEASRLLASLTLAEVTLNDAERARLTPGALLLLPGAFSEDWHVRLCIDGVATHAVEGRLKVASRSLHIDRWQPLDASATPVTTCLCVALPLSVDPLAILPSALSAPLALDSALEEEMVEIRDGEQLIAEGRLMAIGQGQAVLIERLAPAWT